MVTTALVAREQKETEAAYKRETERAAEAEARFELARRAADEMIRLAEEELSDNPFQEGLRSGCSKRRLEYYQEFIAQRGEKPEAQAELAITRDRVKTILDDLAVLQADRQTFLLREPAVLDDLEATAEQRVRLAAMTEPPAGLAVNRFVDRARHPLTSSDSDCSRLLANTKPRWRRSSLPSNVSDSDKSPCNGRDRERSANQMSRGL